MSSYPDLGLTSPAQESWQAPKGSSAPIPPPPAVAAARPWAPGVDGLTVRRHIRRSAVDGAPLLWIVGAHGGAGTSTWARILGVGDAGASWPQHVNPTRALSIVVCCRSTAAGLRAAQDVGIEWAYPHSIFAPWQAQWRFAGENGEGVERSRHINKIAATVAAWTERTLG